MPDDGKKRESRSLKHWKKKQATSQEFRERESRRINDHQKKALREMSEEQRDEKRKKHSQYMVQWREKKKMEANKVKITQSTPNSVLNTTSPRSAFKRKTGFRAKPALLKAVNRLMKETPTSPSKKIVAVSELAKQCGLVVVTPKKTANADISGSQSPRSTSKSPKALTEDVKELVRDFFFQPNVVYTTPGLKDEMVHWEAGKKTKLRRYYLELTLKEAYGVFKEQHSTVNIGFTKFWELKPPNVLLMSKAPSDQCRCVQHENYRLQLKPLKITVDKTFWGKVLCNSDDLSTECWKGTCESCGKGQLLSKLIDEKGLEDDQQVSWHSWVVSETTTKSGKDAKRTVKQLKDGCVAELKELVESSWSSYLRHVRTKRVMSNEFQKDITAENVLVLQVDFAQDYNTKDNAKEVQSAIYGRQNVAIFTAAIFFQGKCTTFGVITDSDKYKSTVRLCMLKILKEYISENDLAEVDKFIIWSDGPSCEFKNKFCTGKLLFELGTLVKRVSWWKYFATAHGKGVCDGVGGTLKSRVAEHAKGKHRDDVTVQTYVDFYELARKYCSSTKLLLISKEEVESITELDKPWDGTLALPGISSIHMAKCGLDGTVEAWKLPGEDPLKPIHYSPSSLQVTLPEIQPLVSALEPTEEVQPDQAQETDDFDIVDRGWYVVQFEDTHGRREMNYVCQVVGENANDQDIVINSYLKVTSSKNSSKQDGKLFKKYPEEERAAKSQFLAPLPAPDFKPSGRVLFNDCVGFSVQ